MRAKLGRTNNSDLLAKEDWIELAKEVQKDFPEITIEQAENIIDKGIKGLLGDMSLPLNFTKIYQWFYISLIHKSEITY